MRPGVRLDRMRWNRRRALSQWCARSVSALQSPIRWLLLMLRVLPLLMLLPLGLLMRRMLRHSRGPAVSRWARLTRHCRFCMQRVLRPWC